MASGEKHFKSKLRLSNVKEVHWLGLLNFLKKRRHERQKVEQPLPDLPPVQPEQPPGQASDTRNQAMPQAPEPAVQSEPASQAAPNADATMQSQQAPRDAPSQATAPSFSEPAMQQAPPVDAQPLPDTPVEKAATTQAEAGDVPLPGLDMDATLASSAQQSNANSQNGYLAGTTPQQQVEEPSSVEMSTAPASEADMQNILASSTQQEASQHQEASEQPDPLQAPQFELPENPADLAPEEVFISKPRYVSFLANVQSLKIQLEEQDQKSVSYDQYVDVLKKGIQQSLEAEDLLKKVEEQIQF